MEAVTPVQTDENKAFIRRMFHDLIEADTFNEGTIARYFSPSYVQKVDGKRLDYASFLDHARELKKALSRVRVTFEEMVAEGNKVMEIHRVEAEKRAGGTIIVRLMSLWVIEDGKIVLCDELSQLEQGEAEDRDLGTRTSKP